jgi:hypothetical protein
LAPFPETKRRLASDTLDAAREMAAKEAQIACLKVHGSERLMRIDNSPRRQFANNLVENPRGEGAVLTRL